MPPEQDNASGQPNTDSATPAAAAPATAENLLADAPTAATADGAAAPATEPTAEQKAAADEKAAKDAEEAKANEVPEEYEDFTAPDGMQLDAEVSAEFKGLAKELGLPQAKAQQVADLGVKMAQKWQAQQADEAAATVAGWADAARADKEIGGAKLTENLAVAKTALNEFGSPELKSMLNETGLGNHPEVIRLLHKVGKAFSEDGIVRGKAAPAPADAAKSLYNNSQMN